MERSTRLPTWIVGRRWTQHQQRAKELAYRRSRPWAVGIWTSESRKPAVPFDLQAIKFPRLRRNTPDAALNQSPVSWVEH